MLPDDRPFWAGLNVFPGIGPVRFRALMSCFGSAEAIWHASFTSLAASGALSPKLVDAFVSFRKRFSPDRYVSELNKERVRLICWDDTAYPMLLKEISDPPFVLYVKGEADVSLLSFTKLIGVVGTRSMTPYGRQVTEALVTDLVFSGCGIVSGMALGVDTIAHETCLRGKGKTVAVLGCGVDIIAPPSNAYLYHRILASGGLIISEMPLGGRPTKGVFPARNRIISGLSRGVVITEGAQDSGALITASYAAEQGREVFAVPGPIMNPMSKGPAKLLKSGATLVEGAQDILELFHFQSAVNSGKSEQAISRTLSHEEEVIVAAIAKEGSMHIDAIVRAVGLPTSHVLSTLIMLEVFGMVKNIGGAQYVVT